MGPRGTIRAPLAVIGLMVVTLGAYAVFWVHAVVREIRDHAQLAGVMSPGAAALLAVVPVLNWVLAYRLCGWVRAVEDQHGEARTNAGLVFVLFLLPVLWPMALWMIQRALNDHWRREIRPVA
jgi:hypothetical protein